VSRPPGDAAARRRAPRRVGELLPDAARALGLEEELRRARAGLAWEAIVGDRLPAAAGGTRAVRVEGDLLVVEAAAPIVGQEIRLRSTELVEAFAAATGIPVTGLRVVVAGGMIR
jgi:Dna[CI] antecedent, DciA